MSEKTSTRKRKSRSRSKKKSVLTFTYQKLFEHKPAIDLLNVIRTTSTSAQVIAKWMQEVFDPILAIYIGYDKKCIEHYNTAKKGGDPVVNGEVDKKKWVLYQKAIEKFQENEIEVKPLPMDREELLAATRVNGQNNVTSAMLNGMAPLLRGYKEPDEPDIPDLDLPDPDDFDDNGKEITDDDLDLDEEFEEEAEGELEPGDEKQEAA